MGLSWQQGPLSPGKVGRFLVAHPLPDRLLYAEPLRRRMRVRFGGAWIADSEHVVLLHEPGRYPVAYFPQVSITAGALEPSEHTTRQPDLGLTSWYTVRAGETRTSTCRNFATISSGIASFAITVLLDVKDIPQVGPLQWGQVTSVASVDPTRMIIYNIHTPRQSEVELVRAQGPQ